jgi:[ribosomal protein S18]-alanine N-acetyltransferase
MTIYIRSMKLDDLDKVHSIDQLSFSMPWPKRSYHYELLENPTSRLWVVEIQNPDGTKDIAGMIVMWIIVDEAHIATLAVHPDYRGRGIAKKLLIVSLKDAISQGMRLATLEVRANNETAQELYRKFGFVISGRRPRYYRDNNEDALIMTLHGLGKDYLHWLEIIDQAEIDVECPTR